MAVKEQIAFNHVGPNGDLKLHRRDNVEYVREVILGRALIDNMEITISFPDGSKTIINPTSEE